MGHNGSTAAKPGSRRHVYKSGMVYEGQWKKNKRHGKGRLQWPDGTSYEGDFANNKLHGFGVMRFINGNVYEGQFVDSNISGDGTLRTSNAEIIAGTWGFIGRNASQLSNSGMGVGTYNLEVTITDTTTGRSQPYTGKATVHLDTGLVVLPGMPSPTIAVMPYAVAVVAESGREIFGSAMMGPGDAAVAVVAAPPPAMQGSRGPQGPQPVVAEARAVPAGAPMGAPAVPLVAVPASAPPPAMSHSDSLEQRLIDQEEQAEWEAEMAMAAAAPAGAGVGAGGVAYGVHDTALDRRPVHAHGKAEVFDPRNYF